MRAAQGTKATDTSGASKQSPRTKGGNTRLHMGMIGSGRSSEEGRAASVLDELALNGSISRANMATTRLPGAAGDADTDVHVTSR